MSGDGVIVSTKTSASQLRQQVVFNINIDKSLLAWLFQPLRGRALVRKRAQIHEENRQPYLGHDAIEAVRVGKSKRLGMQVISDAIPLGALVERESDVGIIVT